MEEVSKIQFIIPETSVTLVYSQLNTRLRENSPKVPRGVEEEFYFKAVNTSEAVESRAKYKEFIR